VVDEYGSLVTFPDGKVSLTLGDLRTNFVRTPSFRSPEDVVKLMASRQQKLIAARKRAPNLSPSV
jgi:hypothetical protein